MNEKTVNVTVFIDIFLATVVVTWAANGEGRMDAMINDNKEGMEQWQKQ